MAQIFLGHAVVGLVMLALIGSIVFPICSLLFPLKLHIKSIQ